MIWGQPDPASLKQNGNDAQEIRRQFDRVQQKVHKQLEEDLEDGGSAAKSPVTASNTAQRRERQCLGCKVRNAMRRLANPATTERNHHERPSGPEIVDWEGSNGENAHRNSKTTATEASHLNAIEKARAHATMLMLSGALSTHDNMRFVVPSTAANMAWYEEPAMSLRTRMANTINAAGN